MNLKVGRNNLIKKKKKKTQQSSTWTLVNQYLFEVQAGDYMVY